MPKLSVRADSSVGSIAMSPGGRDIVLASRNGVYLLDLEDPFSPPRWLPLHSAGEVANIQWCPSPNHPTWVVSSSDQTAVIWNMALPSYRAIEHVLHGHKRAVTDINFSIHQPELLATCSIDTTINAWDVRDTSSPAFRFADFVAGASQAKWSRTDANILASAHDSRVNVWDRRKNNKPLSSFRAHQGKLNGLTFDRKGRIITCSTDRSVKIWDLDNLQSTEAISWDQEEAVPAATITTDFPVWRALPSPVGMGCFVVPLRGGSNQVSLARTDIEGDVVLADVTVDTYTKHTGPVREAIWRHSFSSNNDWDLLTWSKDSTLRMWTLKNETMETLCKSDADSKTPMFVASKEMRNTTYHDEPAETESHGADRSFFGIVCQNRKQDSQRMGQLDWIANVHLSSPHSRQPVLGANSSSATRNMLPRKDSGSVSLNNLEAVISREVTSVSNKHPNIKFEHIDVSVGQCIFAVRKTLADSDKVIVLRVSSQFSSAYPWAPMRATIEEDPNVPPETIAEMDDYLEKANKELALHGVLALNFCVRYLSGERVNLEETIRMAREEAEQFQDTFEISEASDEESGSEVGTTSSDSDDSVIEDAIPLFAPDDEVNAGGLLENSTLKTAVDSTPLPRQCGGHFASNGTLICFFNKHVKASNPGPSNEPVPLDKVFGDTDSDAESLFASDSDDFDPPDRDSVLFAEANWSLAAARIATKVQTTGNTIEARSAVTRDPGSASEPTSHTWIEFIDCSNLIPCRPEIAKRYKLSFLGTNLPEVLEHNAMVAEDLGRHEDAYFWRLAQAYVVPGPVESPLKVDVAPVDALKPFIQDWASHPLGPSFVLKSIAEHLEKSQNVQLLASAACLLASFRRSEMVRVAKSHEELYGATNGLVETTYRFQSRRFEGRGLSDMMDVVSVTQPHDSNRQSASHTPLAYHGQLANTSSGVSSYSTGMHVGASIPQLMRRDTHTSTDRGSFFGEDFSTEPTLGADSSFTNRNSDFTAHEKSLNSGKLSNSGSPGSGPHGNNAKITIKIFDGAVYDTESLAGSSAGPERLIGPSSWTTWQPRLDNYRILYARLLESWGLYIQRLEVLKYIQTPGSLEDEVLSGDRFNVDVMGDMCVYCNSSVRTQFTYCSVCCHMMHASCSQSWWKDGKECATGCGCKCAEYL